MGGIAGGVLGALVGGHIRRESEQRAEFDRMVMNPLHTHFDKREESPLTDDDAERLFEMADSRKRFEKEDAKVLRAELKRIREARMTAEQIAEAKKSQQASTAKAAAEASGPPTTTPISFPSKPEGSAALAPMFLPSPPAPLPSPPTAPFAPVATNIGFGGPRPAWIGNRPLIDRLTERAQALGVNLSDLPIEQRLAVGGMPVPMMPTTTARPGEEIWQGGKRIGGVPLPSAPVTSHPPGSEIWQGTQKVGSVPPLPERVPPDQRLANEWWEANHPGVAITPDKFAEAAAGYKEASMTPTEREIARARIRNYKDLGDLRRLNEQRVGLLVNQFKATHGPDAIAGIVEQMKESPDLIHTITDQSIKNLVIQRWNAETGLPAPRPLRAEMQRTEDTAEIALNHLDVVRNTLRDPVILQRLGPALGRLGNLEQNIGDTMGLSPNESRKIQEFRTGLNYFFFREGRALLSGRPAERLMEQFSKTSANVAMTLPLIEGALAGAETMARAAKISAERYRFGGRTRLGYDPHLPMETGVPGAKTGPVPGMIEDGYRFKGGDPKMPANWERVK